MKPAYLLVAVLFFGAGIGSGWWLAHLSLKPHAVEETPSVFAETARTDSESATAAVDVQWLGVEWQGKARTIPAVVLKDHGVMIVSLYQVYPAVRVVMRERSSGALRFPEVVAASSRIPLVALTWDGPSDSGIELSRDTGSLFLGKEVTLRLPDTRTPATIQSALVRDARGLESFGVEFQRGATGSDGPLTDPAGDRLIGFVVAARALPGQASPPLRAVDAQQIATLLDNDRLPEVMSITAFNQYWSESADGLRLAAERAFAQDNWLDAYASAKRLWDVASDFNDADQRLLTTAAYRYALALIAAGETAAALNITAATRPLYPDAQPWCHVVAQAQAQRRQWQDALRNLDSCFAQMARAPGSGTRGHDSVVDANSLRATYREWVTQLVKDAAQNFTAKVDALQNALDREPDASMYRMLADLQYDARLYAQARRNYELAIQMDPGLATELAARLQTSEQRTTTTPLAEIPFEARRGSIIVSGRLNNSSQSFRLLVDTGATYCALSRATLLRLGLHDVFNRGAPVIELDSAAGPIYAQRFTLDSIALGPARVDKVPVVLLENLEGVDGLIGLSFLRHFGIELDQQAGKLILTRL